MTTYHHDESCLVIIPTYNEKENITLLIPTIFSACKMAHILVVDDASPDGTGDAVVALQSEYKDKLYVLHRAKKLGLGTAYIAGFQYALDNAYPYIVTMDADFSHPPDKIQALYEACSEEGYDMAIGSRYVTGVNLINWPIGRVLLSYTANWITRLITGLPIMDVTAGFQCYKRAILKAIDLQKVTSIGYSFQVEMKFLAWKYGFQLKEIPIIFTNRVRGYSKMSHHIIWEAFFKVIRLKVNSLFKKYHRPIE